MGQITNQTKTRFSWLQSYGLAFTLLFYASHAWAQKIDFSNSTGNKAYVAEGYTDWFITVNNSGGSISNTFDGVTITIGHNSKSVTKGNTLNRSWYNLWTDDEMFLVHDGIYACMNNDDIGGWGATAGVVSIDVKLKGLPAGTHTLQAYHNYVMGNNHTLPTIGVAVNGTTVMSSIEQSQRADTKADCAKSFVTFNVTSTSQEVTITYFSEPVSGRTYTTTYFFINALEIDEVEDEKQAQDPYPANLDYHANVDNGNLTMTWTAAEGATKHQVYFGDDENQVKRRTNYDVETTSTSFVRNGLNPLQTYYWRVDEVIDGQVYKGEVWSFRPRRLAFPGAEGAGKYAIGGRGGDVYHVTNLNDSGEGSLRYGIENATGPRTIVFDVSGVIRLQSRLVCNKPNITIAGQTAPGIGIMLRDYDFGANSDDGITRFMRFRYGHGDDWNGTSANQNTGNAGGLSANYGIMDHCLLGWGSDETFSSRGAKNITFQHSLIGESLNQNGHKNYWDDNHSVQHGFAATVGGDVASLHHNLLAHNEGRNWSLGGGLDGTNHFAGRMNIYNNVCYNWGGRATDGGAHQVNFVGNYYKKGPSTTQNMIFIANHEDNYAGTQEYYLNGNLRVSQDGRTKKSDTLHDTYDQTISSGITVNWQTFVSSPYSDFYGLDESNVESAEAAFKNVLSDVGCNYQELDNNEKRLIQESRDGTFTKTGSRSGKKGLIDKESDSEGWNGLGIVSETRDSDWDTDGDGIPDWFETAKGWSTSDLNNNHLDGASTGWYTDLEIYLNWMACPHFIDLVVDVQKTIDLATYFAGYTNPTYTIVTSDIDVSISNKKLVVNPTTSGLFSVQVKATESSISLTRTFNIYVKPAEEQDENEYNEVTTSEIDTPFSNTGNIFWPLNTGGADQTASVVFGENDVNDLFTVKKITVGSSLNGTNTFTIDDRNLGETRFGSSTSMINNAAENNAVTFYVTLQDGYTFKPSQISVTATRFGTDGGNIDISWNDNGSSTALITKQIPNRDNATINYSTYAYNSFNNQSYSGTFGIKVNIYSLGSSKYIGLKDIIINGTISGTKTTNQTKIILKETANDHFPYKKGKTTVFTDESLPINYANVTLQRTLSNSFWNSFCVPFNISQEQINEIFGGGEVLEFSNATRSSVTFKTVTTGIRAGVPCLFKPINSVTNPDFSQVNITASEEEIVEENGFRFEGHFARYDMATDQSEYFLSTDGKLYYPNPNQNHLLGMRATFTIPPMIARQGIIRMIIDEDMVSEGLDVVDGLQSVDGGFMVSQPVYNLNGQKVGMTNSKLDKGVYIVNGKKVIIQ